MEGGGEHDWAPHKAQRVQEIMYRLRACIREGEGGLEYGVPFATNARGIPLESLLGRELRPEWLLDEALQSRCPEDGQNLLMFAAAQGNGAWFLRLVGEIRSRLGIRALVKELREIDIDGAPLLFHAASCHRKRSCFRTVRDLVTTVLDEGGLMEQVEAVDVMGRNILMHAARSNHRETFELVFSIFEKAETLMGPASPRRDKSTADVVADAASAAADATAAYATTQLRDRLNRENTRVCEMCLKLADDVAKNAVRRTMLAKTDHMSMNCLHHAAELGCKGVLDAVVDKCDEVDLTERRVEDYCRSTTCKQECGEVRELCGKCQPGLGISLKERMNAPDKSASKRTPIMYVLRNSASRIARANGETGLEARFNKLYMDMPKQPPVPRDENKRWWMAPTAVPNYRDSKETRAVTELLHATRGGLESLELVLNTMARPVDHALGKFEVDLDEALAAEVRDEVRDDHRWRSTEVTKTWGRAFLLAAAAKLGDIDVLKHVLAAIETGKFTLVKAAGQARFALVMDHIATGDGVGDEKQETGEGKETEDVKEKAEGEGKDIEDVKEETEREGKEENRDEPKGAKSKEEGDQAHKKVNRIRNKNTPNGHQAGRRRVQEAVKAISQAEFSVFSYAILSGHMNAVQFIYNLIIDLFPYKSRERWLILSGMNNRASSSLTCAASASMETDNHGLDMFEKVLALLRNQAIETQLRDQLSPRPNMKVETMISPLVGAVFSSNWVLFRAVYGAYEKEIGGPWPRTRFKELQKIPSGAPRRAVLDTKELHENTDDVPSLITRLQWNLPPVMWRDIEKGYSRIQSANNAQGAAAGNHTRCSWRDGFKSYSRRAVTVAAERGGFASLRDLVKEGFPLHEDHIPALLENIGDHEAEIVETVLFSVANASNPFAVGALVSRMLWRSEMDHPMHRKGLRRLQTVIDKFTIELLDDLPHTVRGMGVALLGGHQSVFYGRGLHQGKHHRLGNLAGFIVVQWMLEPSLVRTDVDDRKMRDGLETVDPLHRALDRGSKGLDVLNSPLALDYVSVRFSCTLPRWTSRDPFQPTVNEGFYKYHGFEKYNLSEILTPPARETDDGQKRAAKDENFCTMSFLLRFLQGWDHTGSNLKWNFPSRRLHETEKPTNTREPQLFRQPQLAKGVAKPSAKKDISRSIPHQTVLPGLQFSLAGILGRPEIFYQVPVIRFAFEILSYLVMLVLFCWSVLLKEHDSIPVPETVFYIFAAGMLWREVLEFNDGMPSRRHAPPPQISLQASAHMHPEGDPRISDIGSGVKSNRMVSALTRYVFYDTWNFLDTSTIFCILVAFIFRIMALDDETLLFYSQFFLALSAPLLFSRLLVLSQIDSTLGPMTQVIWRMMSQTLRFSAFIAMVMLSFALAFFAVFHSCDADSSGTECGLDDAFGTFGSSFVTVFASALDGPDFDVFDEAHSDCGCEQPDAARMAGIGLMVVYMVVMAVVLLNLFIAVLSTAHDEVYVNAEKEYHLARAKLIHQSARVVTQRRPPPPLNLVKLVLGLVLDTATEVPRLYFMIRGCEFGRKDEGDIPKADEARLPDEGGANRTSGKMRPFSKTPAGKALDDYLQRLAFALTMGAAAVVLSTILWTLSVPWVAWCLPRAVFPAVDPPKNDEDGGHKGGSGVHKHAAPRRPTVSSSRPATDGNGSGGNRNGGGTVGDTNGRGDRSPRSTLLCCCSNRTQKVHAATHAVNDEAERPHGCFLTLFYLHSGYFWRFLHVVGSFLVLLVMTVWAAILCFFYIIASYILWALGIWVLFVKPLAECKKQYDVKWKKRAQGHDNEGSQDAKVSETIPEHMPGQEDGIHWQRAWELATLRNGGAQEHFHVGPFLKSKTGLDTHHLARLVKDRDARSKFEEELVEIDRKLADTHIDLEHLANMAGLGVEKTGEDDADSEQLAEQLIVLANRMVAKRKEEKSNHSY